MIRGTIIAAGLLTLVSTLPGQAQFGPAPTNTVEFSTLIDGKSLPMIIRFKDLDSEWRRLTVSAPDTDTLMQLMMGETGSYQRDVYYTKGQMALLGSERLIVAYRLPPRDLDALLRSRTSNYRFPLVPKKLTPETVLQLSFLNPRMISGLNNIQPFDLRDELTTSEAQFSAAHKAHVEAVNRASMNNLQQLGSTLRNYVQQSGKLPPMKDLEGMQGAIAQQYASFGYSGSPENSPYVHPETKEPYKTNAGLSGKTMKSITDPARTVAIYEASPAPDGTRGVVFVNGRPKRIKESEWAGLKKISKIP